MTKFKIASNHFLKPNTWTNARKKTVIFEFYCWWRGWNNFCLPVDFLDLNNFEIQEIDLEESRVSACWRRHPQWHPEVLPQQSVQQATGLIQF